MTTNENVSPQEGNVKYAGASGFVEAHIKVLEPIVTEQYIEELIHCTDVDDLNDDSIRKYIDKIKSNNSEYNTEYLENTKRSIFKKSIMTFSISFLILSVISIFAYILLNYSFNLTIAVIVSFIVAIFASITVHEFYISRIEELLSMSEWIEYHKLLISKLVKYALSDKAITTLADGKYEIDPVLDKDLADTYIKNCAVLDKPYLLAHLEIMNELGYIAK